MDGGIEHEDELKLSARPYTATILGAIQVLGEAVALAIDLRDRPVLEEMKAVTESMFRQALEILDEQRNVQ